MFPPTAMIRLGLGADLSQVEITGTSVEGSGEPSQPGPQTDPVVEPSCVVPPAGQVEQQDPVVDSSCVVSAAICSVRPPGGRKRSFGLEGHAKAPRLAPLHRGERFSHQPDLAIICSSSDTQQDPVVQSSCVVPPEGAACPSAASGGDEEDRGALCSAAEGG